MDKSAFAQAVIFGFLKESQAGARTSLALVAAGAAHGAGGATSVTSQPGRYQLAQKRVGGLVNFMKSKAGQQKPAQLGAAGPRPPAVPRV